MVLTLAAGSLGAMALRQSPAQGTDPTRTPTPTAPAPIVEEIGSELVDQWRMETVWDCGGTVNRCMHGESEALVLARVAMGEAPNSLSDRVYIMWSIKLNGALGYKEALPGWRLPEDRWGPPTGIYVEALCNGGCQYSPVRAAEQIFFPCELSKHHALRSMLCPTDDQLEEFYWTYIFADQIVQADWSYFPEPLKGYEHFRSPTIDGEGRFHREGGARSRIFFPGGNVWRDEHPQDDEFWRLFSEPTLTTTPERVAPPKATLTPIPKSTSTEAVASPLAFTETPLSPSPTFTHTPTFLTANSPEEVVDRTLTFIVLTVIAALITGAIVSVRDWKRLGGKR